MDYLYNNIVAEFHILTKLYTESKRTEFYVKSPIPIIILLFSYYMFVTKIGPRMMKNREPFKIDGFVKLYNAFQVIFLSSHILPALKLWYNKKNWNCMEISDADEELSFIYFFIKLLDLIETVFFVLRKKEKQISFLHVYHHMMMCFVVWLGLKIMPGGHYVPMGVLNSIVHVVMYIYYFAAATSKTAIWWKKYITIIQITQFVILLVHFTLPLFVECYIPISLSLLTISQGICMITLFSKFYYKTYILKSKKKSV